MPRAQIRFRRIAKALPRFRKLVTELTPPACVDVYETCQATKRTGRWSTNTAMRTRLAVHVIALGLIAASGARAQEPPRAVAELQNAQGEKVGQATFVGKRNGVLIQIEIDKLQPGNYGLHIHERGSCRGRAFKSAGEHFNPSGARHGFKDPEGPHAGDLWNLEVPHDGRLSVKQYSARVTLKEGDDNSVLREGGTSLVLHANRDDYATDPAGDAGPGIACGVIKTTVPPQARPVSDATPVVK